MAVVCALVQIYGLGAKCHLKRTVMITSEDKFRTTEKNIIGFQVHLDESSPHIHALIVPVGQRAKSGRA